MKKSFLVLSGLMLLTSVAVARDAMLTKLQGQIRTKAVRLHLYSRPYDVESPISIGPKEIVNAAHYECSRLLTERDRTGLLRALSATAAVPSSQGPDIRWFIEFIDSKDRVLSTLALGTKWPFVARTNVDASIDERNFALSDVVEAWFDAHRNSFECKPMQAEVR
jgi:hypothetical protein